MVNDSLTTKTLSAAGGSGIRRTSISGNDLLYIYPPILHRLPSHLHTPSSGCSQRLLCPPPRESHLQQHLQRRQLRPPSHPRQRRSRGRRARAACQRCPPRWWWRHASPGGGGGGGGRHVLALGCYGEKREGGGGGRCLQVRGKEGVCELRRAI